MARRLDSPRPVGVGTDVGTSAVPAVPRNVSLQILRGLAASAVLVYHAAHFTAQRTGAAWLESVFSGRLGFYGVLVFFVLSGFLMQAAVHRYDARTFLLHRGARLYPTYWLIFLALYLLQSARLHHWESIPWLALTLLPVGEIPRPLHVEWTLLYEVFFYAVCAVFCLVRRAHLALLIAWLAVVVGAVFGFGSYGSAMQPTLAQVPFSVWNVGFICGSLAAFLVPRLQLRDPGRLWLIGLALLFLGELCETLVRIFLAGPGVALIVAVCSLSPVRAAAGLGTRILFTLGEFSYGLYLAHSLSIQIALQYVSESRLSEPVAVFAGMLGVGLGAGILAGSMDVALYQRLKARIDRRARSGPMSSPNRDPASVAALGTANASKTPEPVE